MLKILGMKLIKVKPVQSNKGLAFFKAWKIVLLLIPPFLLYAMVLVVIAVIKKIGSFVPPKFRIWLLLLIPVAMIMVYIKQEQELNAITDGRFYLVVKNKSSKTASLDKSTWVDFSGNQITFKEGSKETVIQYNSKCRTFKKEGKSYLFVDNHGDLSISDMDSHGSVSYVGPESSMFSAYEDGRVIVYD